MKNDAKRVATGPRIETKSVVDMESPDHTSTANLEVAVGLEPTKASFAD
jgi:hypothetical protein